MSRARLPLSRNVVHPAAIEGCGIRKDRGGAPAPGPWGADQLPGVSMATDRSELTSYEYRQIRARILAASDICIVCGHGAADAVDHIHAASKGGARRDPDNLAPIHGVHGCPVCLRKCNSEKGDRPLADVVQLHTSVDWFAGP